MKASPIGFFDSGVGGTSIWREVVRLLPQESTLYLADSKNAPYGNKTSDEIIALSEKNTEFLLEKNAKIIVVACNTATTNAISHLRQKYAVPFIGIEPAIKPAALQTRTKTIGILATQGTLSSNLFHQTLQRYVRENGISIVEQVGTGLVELIEEGKMESDQMRELLTKYMQKLTAHKMDYLVLGCTHYPYLRPIIASLIDPDITIIDSAEAVARQTQNVLRDAGLLASNPSDRYHKWITNKENSVIQQFAPKDIIVDISYKDF